MVSMMHNLLTESNPNLSLVWRLRTMKEQYLKRCESIIKDLVDKVINFYHISYVPPDIFVVANDECDIDTLDKARYRNQISRVGHGSI